MASNTIRHNRENCIGCSACAGVAPDFWEMGADGKSDLVGGTEREDGSVEKEIEDKDLAANMEAARSCPVNVIHVFKGSDKLI
ncbi:ferredoxin [Candidatus Micrarchaeota archaeon]|nr:ferredoxin [Candidatus Micrarchaeota archaeon]